MGQIGKPDPRAINALKEAYEDEGLRISCLCALADLGITTNQTKATIISLLKSADIGSDDKDRLFSALWRLSS